MAVKDQEALKTRERAGEKCQPQRQDALMDERASSYRSRALGGSYHLKICPRKDLLRYSFRSICSVSTIEFPQSKPCGQASKKDVKAPLLIHETSMSPENQG